MSKTKRYTIAEVKAKNAAAGFQFFDRGTMRFFNSRVESQPYHGAGGVFFITSEHFRGSAGAAPRKYTVRQFTPATGKCKTWGEYNDIRHIEDARVLARAAAKGGAA